MSQTVLASSDEDFEVCPFEFRRAAEERREEQRERSRERSEPEVEVVTSAPAQKSLVDRFADFVMSLLRELEAAISSVGN